jgi:hypothetical protein
MWMYHMPRVAKLFCYTVKHPGSWSDGGSQSRNQLIVLPADERDVADRGFVSNVIGSFVAFHDAIPAEVIKIARFAKGLNFREGTLNVVYIDYGIDEKIDELDPFDRNQATWVAGKGIVNKGDTDREVKSIESFLDFMEDMSFPELIYVLDNMEEDDIHTYSLIKKSKKLILAFKDATVLVEPKGDKIKYELL